MVLGMKFRKVQERQLNRGGEKNERSVSQNIMKGKR